MFVKTQTKNGELDPMSLLKRIMSQAEAQSGKNKRRRRYQDRVLLDFSINFWILVDPHANEIMHDNVPGVFPSPTVVQGKLEKYKSSCIPGIP